MKDNIILINSSLEETTRIIDSINNNTQHVIYDNATKHSDILKYVTHKTTNISLMTHFNEQLPFFNNGKKFISDELLTVFRKINEITDTKLTIDLLVCNINKTEIIDEINKIIKDTNISIRYNTTKLGQENWTLDSDNIDIKKTYFNDNINEWKHHLMSTTGTWKWEVLDSNNDVDTSVGTNGVVSTSNTYTPDSDSYIGKRLKVTVTNGDNSGWLITEPVADNAIYEWYRVDSNGAETKIRDASTNILANDKYRYNSVLK